jgi:cytochrome c oxidase subunit 2
MAFSDASMGTPLSPLSPQADALRNLIVITVTLTGVIALLVTALVLFAVIHYRDRGTGVEPHQTGGNRKIEIAYTLIPLAIMCALFVMTVVTMHNAEPKTADRSPDLVIVAHQWWWELRYPDAHVVTANEIHLPVGKAMLVELRSADVIHELWIPQLGPKMDTVPGMPNHLVLQADQVGEYLGDCAEYCGVGHAWMRLRVVVQPQREFEAWEQEQAKPTLVIGNSDRRGRTLFQSQTCIQCHSIQGVSIAGNVGPDLTHFASRATLGAGVLDNSSAELHRWLSDPQSIKPGCYMPNMRLRSTEINDLTAYLEASK